MSRRRAAALAAGAWVFAAGPSEGNHIRTGHVDRGPDLGVVQP